MVLGSFLQTDAGKRPILKLAQINTLPAVEGDGVDDFLQLDVDLTTVTAFTLYFAIQPISGGPTGAVGLLSISDIPDSSGPFVYVQRGDSSTVNIYVDGDYRWTGLAHPDDELHWYVLSYDAGTWKLDFDGTPLTDYSGGLAGQGFATSIFALSGYAQVSQARVYEVGLTVNEALSGTPRSDLNTYLYDRYHVVPDPRRFIYSGDGLSLSDGTAVSSWTDTTGNGNHATQGTSTRRPVFHTGIVNGLPALYFKHVFVDGVASMMTSPVVWLSTDSLTVTVVVRPDYSGSAYILNGVSPSNDWTLWITDTGADPQNYDFSPGATFAHHYGPALSTGTWTIIQIVQEPSGGNTYYYQDGTLIDTMSTISGPKQVQISGAGGSFTGLGGYIAEVRGEPSALNGTALAAQLSELQTKYGL